MCGIYGYIGQKMAVNDVLNGLRKLEYRGYDSFGLSYLKENSFKAIKKIGCFSKSDLKIVEYSTNCICHTRWATHGKVSLENCHPHFSNDGRFLLVHNGIIENYLELKEKYLNDYLFSSETDSEILVNLISYFAKNDSVIGSLKKIFKLIKGNLAILLCDQENPKRIYYMKYLSPLTVAFGDNGCFFSSDIKAFSNEMLIYSFKDYSYGYVGDNNLFLSLEYSDSLLSWGNSISYSKKITEGSFMYDEIMEEANLANRIIEYTSPMIFAKISNLILSTKRLIFIASGSSYYAACYLRFIFGNRTKGVSECYLASEFLYEKVDLRKSVVILISQSGETVDLLRCLPRLNRNNTILITNNRFSTLGLEIENQINMQAGSECAVAATKSYLATILLFCYLIGYQEEELLQAQLCFKSVIERKNNIKKLAQRLCRYNKVFFIGRGVDYSLACEAALKLREISYINAFAFPSGELKHGSISLVDNDTFVIGFSSQLETEHLVSSNLKEAKARGAESLLLSTRNSQFGFGDMFHQDLALNELSLIVFAQLLSYYVGTLLGHDVDKPRNLAKSVTVE